MRLRLGLGLKKKGSRSAAVPASIAGLQLWLDGADTSTIIHAANAVSQWSDKSANAAHAVQAVGASQPATNTATINARNVIDFAGTTRNLVITNANLNSISLGDNTFFVVTKLDVAAGNLTFLSGNKTPETTDYLTMKWLAPNAPTEHTCFHRNASGTGSRSRGAYGVSTNPQLLVSRRSGIVLNSYSGGVLGTVPGVAENITALERFYIGSFNNTFDFIDGKIAEIIAYNSALSAADINTVGNYLSAKWGIAWANI